MKWRPSGDERASSALRLKGVRQGARYGKRPIAALYRPYLSGETNLARDPGAVVTLLCVGGYQLSAVQELMAHTDPDITKAYQKGHARKVLRVDMKLPFNVPGPDDGIREQREVYLVRRPSARQGIFPENSLTKTLWFS